MVNRVLLFTFLLVANYAGHEWIEVRELVNSRRQSTHVVR
jgi:hypothetical protein